MTKKIHSITRLILFTRLNHRLLILGLSFLSACLGILSPYFQKNFIDLLVYRRTFIPDFLHINSPLWFIFIAAVCLWISQSLNQLTQYLALRESLFMQKKLAKMLYEKMMELKSDTLSKKSIGEVVSLYATDIPSATVYLDQTLPSGASTFFPLLITPIVLIHYFDTSIVLTLILILIISIFNTFLAFRQSKYFYLFKKLASDRLGIVNEWVQNIRTLRILGWTEIFEFKIIQKRILETDNRVKMVTNGQIMNSVTTTATFFINVCTLGTLVCFSKKILTPGEIFSLLWILGVFLTRPFRQMPWFFTFAFDASTSIKRLESFFKISNLVDPQIPEVVAPQLKEQNLAIQVKGLKLNILNDKILDIDSLEIEKGKL
ncbi:MAG: ABC transporter permease, partial [Bdellovibrionaceae bacterium]|nr:ABC transporter permease [Pseudobdellovibrionaceae bacterium]